MCSDCLPPDEKSCSFYMKHGWCAFGATCKFNHPFPPPEDQPKSPMPPMTPPLQQTPIQQSPLQPNAVHQEAHGVDAANGEFRSLDLLKGGTLTVVLTTSLCASGRRRETQMGRCLSRLDICASPVKFVLLPCTWFSSRRGISSFRVATCLCYVAIVLCTLPWFGDRCCIAFLFAFTLASSEKSPSFPVVQGFKSFVSRYIGIVHVIFQLQTSKPHKKSFSIPFLPCGIVDTCLGQNFGRPVCLHYCKQRAGVDQKFWRKHLCLKIIGFF